MLLHVLRQALFSLLLLGTSSFSLEAKILHVSLAGDHTTGATWESAYNTVGAAIAASASGDQIWVASGTFFESIIMKEGVSLFGGFEESNENANLESRDWRANETIIDASGLQTFVVEGASHTTIDGFTIRNGDNREILEDGGGIRVVQVENMTIRNCTITNNKSVPNNPYQFNGSGGGVEVVDSNLRIANCRITKNVAGTGGGMSIVKSVVTIENSLVEKNTFGGGIFFDSSVLRIDNCTFGIGNQYYLSNEDADLDTNTCSNIIHIFNSIVRKTRLTGCFNQETSRLISNSNIPGFPGNGNIDADPLWVDPENGDYRLQLGSPCIDSGTDTGLANDFDSNPRPIDVVGVGIEGSAAYDMGAFEFQLSPADLTRNGKVDGADLLEFQSQWMRD